VENGTEGAQTEKGWFARNLKWLIPCGCMGVVLSCVLFGYLVVAGAMGIMKSADAYTQAVSRARSSAAVTEALGTPLEEGFFVQGNINVTPASGVANLKIPLSGPKGSAEVYAEASKSVDTWTFSVLTVKIDGSGQEIDLLVASQPEQGN
jgi:hypothetical protein